MICETIHLTSCEFKPTTIICIVHYLEIRMITSYIMNWIKTWSTSTGVWVICWTPEVGNCNARSIIYQVISFRAIVLEGMVKSTPMAHFMRKGSAKIEGRIGTAWKCWTMDNNTIIQRVAGVVPRKCRISQKAYSKFGEVDIQSRSTTFS